MHASRGFDRSALTALAPALALVPFWLIAMLLIWLPLRLAVDIPWWWVPVGWLALGIVLIIPPVQVAIVTPLLGARRMTPAEERTVRPLWDEVATAAGFRPSTYRIRMIDSDELNGYASGGYLIVLTTFAVSELSADELSGVLAHEVSHHIGLHTVALSIGQWLSVPVLALARIGFFLRSVAQAATSTLGSGSTVAAVIGGIFSGLLNGVAWIFLLGLKSTGALNNLVSKQSEFDADLRAVRMGYGPELRSALRAVVRYGGGQRARGWKERISTAHPAARTRVAHIESLMGVPAVREANRRRDQHRAPRQTATQAHTPQRGSTRPRSTGPR